MESLRSAFHRYDPQFSMATPVADERTFGVARLPREKGPGSTGRTKVLTYACRDDPWHKSRPRICVSVSAFCQEAGATRPKPTDSRGHGCTQGRHQRLSAAVDGSRLPLQPRDIRHNRPFSSVAPCSPCHPCVSSRRLGRCPPGKFRLRSRPTFDPAPPLYRPLSVQIRRRRPTRIRQTRRHP